MNLINTITPRTDQQNSDDFLTGPRTIRITAVSAGTAEQPVNVSFDGDNGRPWKPSKGMRRVLVALYGEQSDGFLGKWVTLFNDTTVTFGSDTTGGIRISHASGITQPLTIALTVKRGKRKPFVVQPLPEYSQALESLKMAAQTGGDAALRAAFTALSPELQAILRTDATNLKAKA